MQQLNEDDFKKISNPVYDLEKEKDETQLNMLEIYRNLIDILKEYLDLREDYYPIIALWIIGKYRHEEFLSYPYLFFNAMKGSGKSRLMKLLTYLCNGSMLNSLTEATMFRTKDMLGIDEFEGITRKGREELRELLNSAYKKGIKVRRMRKVHNKDGEQQVVDEFEVYRPIAMANIYGLENVLEDRCLTLILEKSNNQEIVNKAEIWEIEPKSIQTKELLVKSCSLCNVVALHGVYRGWNLYLNTKLHNYINNTNYTNYTNYIDTIFYDKIYNSEIGGRDFELTFPLLWIAHNIEEEVFENALSILKEIIKERRAEDFIENRDVSLMEFISGELDDNKWVSIKSLLISFKQFLQEDEEWINVKWIGKALKRLNLYKERRRMTQGVYVILNVPKAQEKIKMFK